MILHIQFMNSINGFLLTTFNYIYAYLNLNERIGTSHRFPLLNAGIETI